MRPLLIVLALLAFAACGSPDAASSSILAGDSRLSPPAGVLCTAADPSFDGYRYAEQIAHCKRQVSDALKRKVAARYGIPQSEWSNYEFDHYLPLGIGGSNDINNLWPEPLVQAHDKDRVEDQAYHGMNNGTLTQAQAVRLIRAFQPSTATAWH